MQCEVTSSGLQIIPTTATEKFAVETWLAAGARIEGASGCGCRAGATTAKVAAPTPAPAPAAVASAPVMPALKDVEDMSRDELKAAAQELGIAFKEQTRTNTLRDMVINALGGNHSDKSDVEKIKRETAPAVQSETDFMPASTPKKCGLVDVRNALLALADRKGKAAAIDLLAKFGAKKVSDLTDDSVFGQIVEEAQA